MTKDDDGRVGYADGHEDMDENCKRQRIYDGNHDAYQDRCYDSLW